MTKKVIILKGLQGSGKSTWAKKTVDEGQGKYKRISKDDLRAMLDNSKHTKGNENFVLRIRDFLILETLQENKIPIVDDTNLNPIHEESIRKLVDGIAEVEIKFFDKPIDECIANDMKRPNPVGKKVIMDTYNRWLCKPIQPVPYDPDLPDAIIIDCDGTIALFENKNPYDRDFENDTVNEPVAKILKLYQKFTECNFIYVSGRQEKFRNQTMEFLRKNNLLVDALYMRPDGDQRKDSIIKQEIYDNFIRGDFNITLVLDDRNQTVKTWRDNGLTCLQVADGDF